jgi:hypothetical protein
MEVMFLGSGDAFASGGRFQQLSDALTAKKFDA